MSYSSSVSQTFTATNAKHLASKVASDLYQCSRLYGYPAASDVEDYQEELVVMLTGGYLQSYEFGFKKNGKRVLTWYYEVDASGNLVGGNDDRSGGIYAHADVSDADYFNFMTYSSKYSNLTGGDQDNVKRQHQVKRGAGSAPSNSIYGTWHTERTYTSGGVRVERKSFR